MDDGNEREDTENQRPTGAATSTRSLGAASENCTSQTATVIGDTCYVVSNRISPPIIGAFDLTKRRCTDIGELPASSGSKGVAPLNDGEDLYLAAHARARLYHVDTDTLAATTAFDPETQFMHDVAAVPGENAIAMGTKPKQVVYEYDHVTGEVRDYGQPVPGEDYVKSVAATADTIFAGVGSDAHLVAIDRRTGGMAEILPPELHEESFVREAEVGDGYLAIGTAPNAYVAIIDLEDYTNYRIQQSYTAGDHPCVITDVLPEPETDRCYFADGKDRGRLFSWELSTDEISTLMSGEFAVREMDRWNDRLVCLNNHRIVVYETDGRNASREFEIDLQTGGMPGRPEEVMSVEVLEGNPHVGGHLQNTIHDPDSGSTHRYTFKGEAKVMTPIDGRMYLGVYGKAKISRYDPQTDEYEELVVIGDGQHRPRSIHYHQPTGRLLVGTRPFYGLLGGAVATFDPSTDELLAVDRHVFEDQSVNAITSVDDTVYLASEIYGGGGIEPTTSSARIGAWDPIDRQMSWVTDMDDADAITSLVTYRGLLYALTDGKAGPTLASVDPSSREITRIATYSEGGGSGEILRREDAIIGVTENQLFRYDPTTDETSILVDGLDPSSNTWHNVPQLDVCPDGTMYVVKDRDLVAVNY